mmetsp:Transcript_15293/g.33759  ORF Transcript_15293/g.33759 Transcript_15293/m.33759 type:complete len:323 (-) Transcript_15293:991-1959(-)
MPRRPHHTGAHGAAGREALAVEVGSGDGLVAFLLPPHEHIQVVVLGALVPRCARARPLQQLPPPLLPGLHLVRVQLGDERELLHHHLRVHLQRLLGREVALVERGAEQPREREVLDPPEPPEPLRHALLELGGAVALGHDDGQQVGLVLRDQVLRDAVEAPAARAHCRGHALYVLLEGVVEDAGLAFIQALADVALLGQHVPAPELVVLQYEGLVLAQDVGVARVGVGCALVHELHVAGIVGGAHHGHRHVAPCRHEGHAAHARGEARVPEHLDLRHAQSVELLQLQPHIASLRVGGAAPGAAAAVFGQLCAADGTAQVVLQ